MDFESWRKKVGTIKKFVACTKENGVRAKITIAVKNTRRIEFEKAKKDENCQELSGCWNLAKDLGYADTAGSLDNLVEIDVMLDAYIKKIRSAEK